MNITILCDQTDCIHCKGGNTGNNYCYETRCTNKSTIVIWPEKGCIAKETKSVLTTHDLLEIDEVEKIKNTPSEEDLEIYMNNGLY